MNKVTDEQVEAAAKASAVKRYEYVNIGRKFAELAQCEKDEWVRSESRLVPAALEAAADVASQAERERDALRALIEDRARVIGGYAGAEDNVAAEQKAIARSIWRDLEDHDAEFANASVQPSSTVDEGMTGQVVTASFESGERDFDCGLEDCECPEHEQKPYPAGTYITVKLDKDYPVGLMNVVVREVVEAIGGEGR